MHPLCRRYCKACEACKACKATLCPTCNVPTAYANVTDEQRTAFQAILNNPEGDPEDAFIHSGLLKTRRDAEAFMNYLWPKRDSYPLMFTLLEDFLSLFERALQRPIRGK